MAHQPHDDLDAVRGILVAVLLTFLLVAIGIVAAVVFAT